MAAATMNHEEARRVVPHERAQHMNMTRVALATYAALPALHPDDQLLLASLKTMGITLKPPCRPALKHPATGDFRVQWERDGRLLLMELECLEPHLFLGYAATAPDRLAHAVMSASRDKGSRTSRQGDTA